MKVKQNQNVNAQKFRNIPKFVRRLASSSALFSRHTQNVSINMHALLSLSRASISSNHHDAEFTAVSKNLMKQNIYDRKRC